jgi:hypothetical protein
LSIQLRHVCTGKESGDSGDYKVLVEEDGSLVPAVKATT